MSCCANAHDAGTRASANASRRPFEASWFLFVVASLALIATPGQDMMLVMSRSIAQGARAGVATAAGVSVGLVGHTILATLGLDAILRSSEWRFVALNLASAVARHPAVTVFALGLAFAALTFVVKAPLGLSAGARSAWPRARPAVPRWICRCCGAMLLGLGARLALERR